MHFFEKVSYNLDISYTRIYTFSTESKNPMIQLTTQQNGQQYLFFYIIGIQVNLSLLLI